MTSLGSPPNKLRVHPSPRPIDTLNGPVYLECYIKLPYLQILGNALEYLILRSLFIPAPGVKNDDGRHQWICGIKISTTGGTVSSAIFTPLVRFAVTPVTGRENGPETFVLAKNIRNPASQTAVRVGELWDHPPRTAEMGPRPYQPLSSASP
ncbi:hypothetical protein EYZ11_008480 [Aspergillus tanneri]|uniref:Uncharacterized protein n=1 Tax=Aspergillus tanneri TaxID=1220188 RepID=A0A4S3JAN7_9EURO|nr:hypothetical protein EYZ11_008480 [Aspergillus tanneri]